MIRSPLSSAIRSAVRSPVRPPFGLSGDLPPLPLFYEVGAQFWPAYKSAYLDGLAAEPDLTVATRSNMGATMTDTFKWFGATLGPDGKIYCVPFNATDILIIDPIAGTASRSNMGASLTGTVKWYGATLGPDGKIYCVPSNATDSLIIGDGTPGPLEALMSGWINKF